MITLKAEDVNLKLTPTQSTKLCVCSIVVCNEYIGITSMCTTVELK